MKEQKPELMLPAGNMDMLKAAVINGADAVYFGTKKFNARMPAQNFSGEELKDAIDFCHFHEKKAYLTLNTLIKDSEMEEAIEVAKQAYELGIDALIMQDLGLIKALRKLLPELELHASTQMTCHNSAGAKFLENIGIKKIVLARELGLEEIKKIRESTKAKTEVFVHGALCFSYSGQCLMSSFLFNKSGNRGMCLQPCRLPYTLSIGEKNEKRNGYLLSMKDLMTINNVKELVDAGIDAFKIEGRLKGVGYAAATARAYRLAIDSAVGKGKPPSKEEINMMKVAFLREDTVGHALGEKEITFPESPSKKGVLTAEVIGFNKEIVTLKVYEQLEKWDKLSVILGDKALGFYVNRIIKNGKDIPRAYAGEFVAIETGKRPHLQKGEKLYINSSKRIDDFAYGSIAKTKKIPYNLHVAVETGKKVSAKAEFGGKKALIEFDFIPAESKTSETSEGMLKEKLFKFGEFFEPLKFSAEIKGNPFFPLSQLKKFKNIILSEMHEELFKGGRKKVDEEKFAEAKKTLLALRNTTLPKPHSKKQEIVLFIDGENKEVEAEAEKIADSIVFNSSAANPKTAKKILVKAPNIQSDSVLEEFEKNHIKKKEKIVCANLGALQKAIENKSEFWADRELNIFNSLAAELMVEMGAQKIVPSVELSLEEIEKLAHLEKIAPLVFFYPALMTSKSYSTQAKALGKNCVLEDRKDFKYKFKFDEKGILRIYNPVPVDMLFEFEKFEKFSAIGIDLTATEKEEALQVIDYLTKTLAGENPQKKYAKFTRGHYLKGIE